MLCQSDEYFALGAVRSQVSDHLAINDLNVNLLQVFLHLPHDAITHESVRLASKSEELNVSKSRPLCANERPL